MSNLVFEPFAAEQRWWMPAPFPGRIWQELLAEYLAALARACAGAGPCVIGHLKALALFPEGSYLRISAVSAHHPPTLDGRAPDSLQALDLTLNLLVYGLPRAALARIASEEATRLAALHGGHVDTHHAAHHHPPEEHPPDGGQ